MNESTMHRRSVACPPIQRITRALCALALSIGLLTLGVGTSPAQADEATQDALTALSTNNWCALYAMLDDDVRAAQSEDDFTARMSAGLPEFFDAAVDGEITEARVFGTTITVVPVTLSAHAADSSILTYRVKLQLSDGHPDVDEACTPGSVSGRCDAGCAQSDRHQQLVGVVQLLDDDLKKTNSEREFTAKVTRQGYTKFSGADIAGPAAEDHILGSSLTTVPLRLRAEASDGSMQTYTSTLQIVDGQVVGLKTPVLAS